MDPDSFYHSIEWQHKRAEILARDHHECVLCREGKGYKPGRRHTRAVIVHHVQHLRDRPDLALSDTYTDADGVEHRQLISVLAGRRLSSGTLSGWSGRVEQSTVFNSCKNH